MVMRHRLSLEDIVGHIDESAYVAPGAHIIGDVTIGAHSSVWPCAVIRGDVAPIVVGERTNIQDGAILHGATGAPVVVGDGVTIGHAAIVHGCTVLDGALVGMGSIVLNGAIIGEHALVGAGSLVTERHEVRPRTLAFGRPAREVRGLSDEEVADLDESARLYVRLAREAQDGH